MYVADEHLTSAVLSKHNSGYVLIKAKDAHEFEFRLTGNEDSSPQPSPKKLAIAPKSPSTSPEKRKELPKKKVGAMVYKSKSKLLAKNKGLKLKTKMSPSKEMSPSTKVNLKTLLTGRKVAAAAAARKAKLAMGQKTPPPIRKSKRRSKGKRHDGPDTPTQSKGLQALLEAASQIDRLDASSSPSASDSGSKRTSRRLAEASSNRAKGDSAGKQINLSALSKFLSKPGNLNNLNIEGSEDLSEEQVPSTSRVGNRPGTRSHMKKMRKESTEASSSGEEPTGTSDESETGGNSMLKHLLRLGAPAMNKMAQEAASAQLVYVPSAPDVFQPSESSETEADKSKASDVEAKDNTESEYELASSEASISPEKSHSVKASISRENVIVQAEQTGANVEYQLIPKSEVEMGNEMGQCTVKEELPASPSTSQVTLCLNTSGGLIPFTLEIVSSCGVRLKRLIVDCLTDRTPH